MVDGTFAKFSSQIVNPSRHKAKVATTISDRPSLHSKPVVLGQSSSKAGILFFHSLKELRAETEPHSDWARESAHNASVARSDQLQAGNTTDSAFLEGMLSEPQKITSSALRSITTDNLIQPIPLLIFPDPHIAIENSLPAPSEVLMVSFRSSLCSEEPLSISMSPI